MGVKANEYSNSFFDFSLALISTEPDGFMVLWF